MGLSTALKILRRSSDQVNLDSMIFFVTSICNAKCGTCFYWESLNQKGDLTLDEVRQVTEHMPKFRSLLLSGGEPTLRKDVVDVVGLFVKNNGIETLSMPTNGLIPALAVQVTKGFLALSPKLSVTVSVSIDGMGKTHDDIRGVPGNYEKALQTLDQLLALRKDHKNLAVNVTTVVCEKNLHELKDFAEYLFKNYELDMHSLVLIRGDPMIHDLLLTDMKVISEFKQFHNELNTRYFKRRVEQKRASRTVLGRIWEQGYSLETQDITYRNFTSKADWPFGCLAGKIIGVIDWNGAVRACELRNPVANLRQYGYDFQKLWNGPEMTREVEAIAKEKCFCTHGCFLQPSQSHHRMSSLVRGPLKALGYRLTHLWQ